MTNTNPTLLVEPNVEIKRAVHQSLSTIQEGSPSRSVKLVEEASVAMEEKRRTLSYYKKPQFIGVSLVCKHLLSMLATLIWQD